MSQHYFSVPALDSALAQAEFNRFCADHRVLRIEQHFVADGAQSFWALCAVVIEGRGPLPAALKRSGHAARADDAAHSAIPASKVDYKQVLTESDFTVFAALRNLRKALAEQEGVPLFAVFTNEQLAAIARQRCDSLAALGQIDGIGAARLQRYGAAVLQALAGPA